MTDDEQLEPAASPSEDSTGEPDGFSQIQMGYCSYCDFYIGGIGEYRSLAAGCYRCGRDIEEVPLVRADTLAEKIDDAIEDVRNEFGMDDTAQTAITALRERLRNHLTGEVDTGRTAPGSAQDGGGSD